MVTKYSKAAYEKKRDRLRDKLLSYISNKKCVDCGESDFVVLQFDHVRGKKKSSVTRMVNSCCKWEDILKEIKKCEVVCANCHQRRTAKQQKWYYSLLFDRRKILIGTKP